MLLTPELCELVVLQLPPRFVYRLMQTNKRFCELCRSHEEYWGRVALYLVWSSSASDVLLLRMSYGRAMESFVERVRSEMQALSGVSTGTLRELLDFALARDEYARDEPHYDEYALVRDEEVRNEAYALVRARPWKKAIEVAKRRVEDADNVAHAMRRSRRGMDVPRRWPCFVTGSRRARRATSRFLRSLEDEAGMDLEAKVRVRGYVRDLLEDITERRGRMRWGSYFELHEEDIDATFIYL